MTALPTTPKAKAKVPLLLLHSAYRLARDRGDLATAEGIAAVFKSVRKTPLAKAILKAADSRASGYALPFQRDRVDVLAACAISGAAEGLELQLFSDGSLVDLGFVRVCGGCATYVDRVPLPDPEGCEVLELLPAGSVADLLAALRLLDEHPACVVVPDDPAVLLEIHADILEAGSNKVDPVGISLVRVDTAAKGRVAVRRLGSSRVTVTSPEVWTVSVSASITLEIHAAALAGHWLELTSPAMRLLAPLPDFTRAGAKVDAWLHPQLAIAEAAGRDAEKPLVVPRELAVDLCRRHHWFLPHDLDVCLAAADGS